eukprot:380705_1
MAQDAYTMIPYHPGYYLFKSNNVFNFLNCTTLFSMLSLTKGKLQSIDKKTLPIVYGYMRQESEKLVSQKIIPSSLFQIVVMFYFENIFDEYIIKVLEEVHADIDIIIPA